MCVLASTRWQAQARAEDLRVEHVAARDGDHGQQGDGVDRDRAGGGLVVVHPVEGAHVRRGLALDVVVDAGQLPLEPEVPEDAPVRKEVGPQEAPEVRAERHHHRGQRGPDGVPARG